MPLTTLNKCVLSWQSQGRDATVTSSELFWVRRHLWMARAGSCHCLAGRPPCPFHSPPWTHFPIMLLLVCQNKPELIQTVRTDGVGITHRGHSSWHAVPARSVLQAVKPGNLFLAYSQPDLSVKHFEVTTSAHLMIVHFERCHFKNFWKFQNCPVGDLFHAKMSFQILNYILPHTFTL